MKKIMILVAIAASLATTASALATQWVSRHGLTATQYQNEFNLWTAAPYHYRLISVGGYEHNGQARYAAIWAATSGPHWVTYAGLTQSRYNATNSILSTQGFHPVFVSAFGVGSLALYNAIWEYSPGDDVVSQVGLSYAGYLSADITHIQQGYKLVDLCTCNAGTTEYFSAIWRKGDAANYTARTHRTASQYQQDFNTLANDGYQLIAVSAAMVNGQALYTGIWKMPGNGTAWYSYNGLSAANYQGATYNGYYKGYRPTFASAFNSPDGEHFNVIFQHNGGMSSGNLQTINNAISGYMNSNNVPGLSLAISRDGHLLYAQGFGYADKSTHEWVHPLHRFRIASISKTITAAAILKLRDLCGLKLDQTVFGPGALLGQTFGTPPYTTRERAITVRHLLNHTSGWSTDGIWKVTSDDPDDAIDWQLDNSSGEPSHYPGTYYTYMNIGFCTLGRVIERRSGRTYEQFVKDEILGPSCITDMEIGGRTLADRKPGEVVYYKADSKEMDPYDLSPERMDAHGGWIATPMDLLLFMRRIDSNTNQAEILRGTSLTAMRTPSMAPGPNGGGTNYGFGMITKSSWFGHNGAMPGTIGFLVYRTDGFAFAVTCNSRPANDQYCYVLESLISGVINTLSSANAWPNYDLFSCDVPPGDSPQTMVVTHDIYVDGSASCPYPNGSKNCGLIGGPFHTVNQALGNLCAGDRLYIRTGTYDEPAFFNRWTTARSYDGSATVGQ